MKIKTIFIDFSNKRQVAWFKTRGLKLVKMIYVTSMYETATGKEVGRFYRPIGLFARKAIKEAESFIDNPVTETIKA